VNGYEILAGTTLALHLAFITWVLFGWLVTPGRRWLRGLHVGSVLYGAFIMASPWACPLTYAENYFKRRAGLDPYADPFLIHYLEALVYPEANQTLLSVSAVVVCLGILGIYVFRFRRHTAG
jgi:hypothetical protein